jgi:hypothetical protein
MTRVMIRQMNPSKFQIESEIVDRFLRAVGYTNFSLHDPNVPPATETGADVLVILDGKRYGVQVTVLHTDEGLDQSRKGSELRRQEAAFKNSTQPYAAWGTPNPMTALQYRIAEKCAKSYPAANFDEVVLLVVSGMPQMGAIASTLVLDLALQVDKMNAELAPMLEGSRYGSAYLFNMMGIGGPSVYEWKKGVGWRKIPRAADQI